MFRIPLARALLIRMLGSRGMYEWVIARTRYVDAVFARAATAGFTQVLLLGAGFDSRAIRFQSELYGASIFELDAKPTQTAKIEQYRKRSIPVPSNLRFVSIDFEKETLSQKLRDAGFAEGAKTLVLMEGVMQYLAPDAAYSTLGVLMDLVGKGSWLIFDYAHSPVVKGEDGRTDATQVAGKLASVKESWQFGLTEYDVAPLLARFGFRILDLRNPTDLQEMYFKDALGRVVAHVSNTQSIVMAERY
jgi:methyltransferase (TIGR00027 family)